MNAEDRRAPGKGARDLSRRNARPAKTPPPIPNRCAGPTSCGPKAEFQAGDPLLISASLGLDSANDASSLTTRVIFCHAAHLQRFQQCWRGRNDFELASVS